MALEKQKKLHIVRYAVTAVLILLFSVMQNTKGFFPEINGIRAVLLVQAVVCAAMFERDIAGMFFGLFAGLLWDMSASGNNFYAVFLLTVGFVSGSLINTVMRRSLITSVILSGAWLLVFFIGSWFFRFIVGGLDMKGYMLLHFYLPSFIFSFVLSPVFFFIFNELSKLLKRD